MVRGLHCLAVGKGPIAGRRPRAGFITPAAPGPAPSRANAPPCAGGAYTQPSQGHPEPKPEPERAPSQLPGKPEQSRQLGCNPVTGAGG